jgi:hypothetical protein
MANLLFQRLVCRKTHGLAGLRFLNQINHGELDAEEAVAATVAEYEAKIAALERKVNAGAT